MEHYSKVLPIKVIYFFNPCKKLSMQIFGILESVDRREIWCCFNAHINLWGRDHVDINGEVVEELIDERSFVCLNDGSDTAVDVTRNSVSCIDLTLLSGNMSNLCEWKVIK